MMRAFPGAALAAAMGMAVQPPAAPLERATLRLHYVQKPIGYERYEIAREGDGLRLTADFDFTDRGGNVHLASTLQTKADYTPVHFTAKGRSYRFVNVDSEVTSDGHEAVVRADGAQTRVATPAAFFTVDGYAPFAAQMLMLRYWKQHGQPPVVRTAPGSPLNDVIMTARGRDDIRIGSKTVRLDRYTLDGVVWGRETVWLDEQGGVAAATTRAGGLGFEAVREDLEPALVTFVKRAARDSISDLEQITATLPIIKSGTYALLGGTIVDGTDRAPVADGVVIVRDGRIAEVGARTSVTVPSDVPGVSIAGATIVPGLWDMHTHVTQVEWAPVYLAAGVTTVRDMGNEFEFVTALREAIQSGCIAGPLLLLAGLVDGGGPNAFGVAEATTPEQARQVVERYHAAGFQQIKIYSLITPPIVEALSAEAHRLQMTVTGHIPTGMTVEQAVSAGFDQIAHLPIRGEAGAEDVTRTIAFLRDHKTVIDPTQSWGELLGHAAGTPISAFQPDVVKIPPPLNRLFANAGTAGIDSAVARARVERGLRIVKALHDAGVPVVVGTDEGIPGHSVHREIELYAEAGLTPLKALQAATIVPARAMFMDTVLGTIQRGKRADLVVLNANPLDDIRNIRKVRWTIRGGKIYDTASLWRSVRFEP
jgi:imidazolonepropionase-like amidohydrolase